MKTNKTYNSVHELVFVDWFNWVRFITRSKLHCFLTGFHVHKFKMFWSNSNVITSNITSNKILDRTQCSQLEAASLYLFRTTCFPKSFRADIFLIFSLSLASIQVWWDVRTPARQYTAHCILLRAKTKKTAWYRRHTSCFLYLTFPLIFPYTGRT